VYIFVDDYYYRFRDHLLDAVPSDSLTLDTGYPKRIDKSWIDLPSNVDAVFSLPNGFIYFFKDDMYFRVRDKYLDPNGVLDRPDRVESCYPKLTSTKFLGVTTPVRTAFRRKSDRNIYFIYSATWVSNFDKYLQTSFLDRLSVSQPIPAQNYCVPFGPVTDPNFLVDWNAAGAVTTVFQRKTGKIYVFQTGPGITGRYWRFTDRHYSPDLTDCLDLGYPKLITDTFTGAPAVIRAVFQRDNGRLYFFGDDTYVRYADKYIDPEVDPDVPTAPDVGYPLPISNFGILSWPAGSVVAGAFQRVNGKIYIFRRLGTSVDYFRITDKYLTGGAVLQDVVDPGYDLGKPLAESWEGAPVDFTTVYQRSESDQRIYFLQGASYQTAIDKYIYVPGICTACEASVPEDD